MERRTRSLSLSLSLGVALAAALTPACSGRGQKAALPAPAGAAARAVRVIRPAATIETGLARSTGTIRAREDAILSAKATGQIRRIRVEMGDRVQAGAVLAEMDSTNAQIALQNARALQRLSQARLDDAERGVTRSRVLFEGEGMAQSKFEEVQTGREMAAAQLDQARAAVRQAEQALRDATVTAPFAGIVTGRFRNAGDTVTMMPVSPIVALTDVDHLEVRLSVPEALEPAIAVGQTVEGTTTPGGQRFQAKVRVKNAVVDLATRTIEVLADVVKADGLRPGTLVNADFGRFGEGGGVFVPATAVRTDGKASWVMVVAGGKAERREVVAQPVHPGTVVVKQGLAPDADVIVDPGALAAGDAVVALAN